MTIPYPDDSSEHILRRTSANRTAGFVGVAGGTSGAHRLLPIRLQFSDPALNCHANATSLDQTLLKHPLGVGKREDGKRPSEPGLPLLPPACIFAPDGHCPPCNQLDITLDNEEIGRLAFLPSLNSLRTLAPKWQSFPVIAGKRLAYLQMEFRLRGKPARLHAGRPIYYVDLTFRSGTTLEKTLANARGTASRWFRSDRPGQSRLTRLRHRHLRNQIRRKARGYGESPSGNQGHRYNQPSIISYL